jgi:hypothetical protein
LRRSLPGFAEVVLVSFARDSDNAAGYRRWSLHSPVFSCIFYQQHFGTVNFPIGCHISHTIIRPSPTFKHQKQILATFLKKIWFLPPYSGYEPSLVYDWDSMVPRRTLADFRARRLGSHV